MLQRKCYSIYWHSLNSATTKYNIFQVNSEKTFSVKLIKIRNSSKGTKFLDTFNSFWTFSYSQNFKFACCLGGFHLWLALNLLNYALFYSYHTQALPF